MSAVLVERDGHLMTVTLNRPERMNSINGEVLVGLLDAMVEADRNPDIRCVILTGAGGNFCAGADLKEMSGGGSGSSEISERMAADPDLPWKALLRTFRPEVPLICAVEGTAIAGGTELLLATDIRVAGESSKFGVSEVRWSLYPMGGSVVRLSRQIPYTVAAEILLTGKHITAAEAHQIGLIGSVVPDGQALSRAREIGETICENGPLAVQAVLTTLREASGVPEQQALAAEFDRGWAVFASEDAQEGPLAFSQKRKPNFQGK